VRINGPPRVFKKTLHENDAAAAPQLRDLPPYFFAGATVGGIGAGEGDVFPVSRSWVTGCEVPNRGAIGSVSAAKFVHGGIRYRFPAFTVAVRSYDFVCQDMKYD
jgi:hypothetical protein